MRKKTYLGNAIDVAGDKAKYDSEAKKLVSDKTVLSWIAKYCIKELKDFTLEEIVACIEGEPEVEEIPAYPGKKKPEAIVGLSTEDKVPNEGEVTYDVKFYLIMPKGERIKLIINIELQKDFYSGYDLVTRAVFYCARMLSAQMNTEFSAENYDEVKKVYSIWICLKAPKSTADTIVRYQMQPEILVGEKEGGHRYDLLAVVMIGLNENSAQRRKTRLHGLLGTLFSDRLSPNEKIDILQNEYGIETTVQMKEGIDRMCNLSDAIEERGMQKGMQKGMRKGEQRVNLLIQALIENSRSDEIGKAVKDSRYQKKLFQEFQL